MRRVTVEPAVLLYSVSYIAQLCIQQDFIFTRFCNEHFSQEVCAAGRSPGSAGKVQGVQDEAVRFVMWLSVITSLVSFVTAQFFGAALDRYPQKVVMLAPFVGTLALHVVCVVAAAVPSLSLYVLFAGALLNGLSGGYPVFKSSMSSYVVRISSAESRTCRLSVVEGMVFLGNALGPFIIQQVLTYTACRHDYLFLGSEGAVALAALYIMFFLPHSPPGPLEVVTAEPEEECRRSPCACVTVVLKEFIGTIGIAFRRRSAGRRTAIIMLMLADFFIAIVFSAEFDLLYLFMKDQLAFDLTQYSRYLAIKNLVNGLSLLGLLPALRRFLKLSDGSLGVLGGVSRVAAFTMLALNYSCNLVFIVPLLDVCGQYLFVVLRSLLCSLVDPGEQGRILTVLSSLAQLSLLAGSLVFDNLYPAFLALGQPGYTFLLAAVFMAISTSILGCTRWRLIKFKSSGEVQPLLR